MGLLAILVLYASAIVALHPTRFFGLTEDDSIYLSSAHALAEEHGYILESVPGAPAATKYPVFYPWLLSRIWRWQPAFPGNLPYAIGLNVVFGCAYLTAAFRLVRRIGDLSQIEALGVTAFCALHPVVLFHSANLLSEMPFAALSLGAVLLAEKATGEQGHAACGISSGVLAGLALLIRVLGAPMISGLGLAILLRRGWRQCALFAAGAAPFVAFCMGWSAWQRPAAVVDGTGCARVWQATWLYYTDYLGFWKADVLAGHVLWQVVKQNLVMLFLQPGSYLVEPGFLRPAVLAFAPAAVLSAAAVGGLFVRRARPWRPMHWALVAYLVPLLLWDYPVMQRFLIPFLPLLVAGVWLEAKTVTRRILVSLRTDSKDERFAAVFLSAAMGGLLLASAWSFGVGHRMLAQQSHTRAQIGRDKREAYDWLRKSTAEGARVVAYEDASLYLHSGRQAIRPVIFSPSGTFRPEQLESEIACMTESAAAIRANYWVIADDDFGFEWQLAESRGKQREREYEQTLPLAFQSSGGRVRVYRLLAQGNGFGGGTAGRGLP